MLGQQNARLNQLVEQATSEDLKSPNSEYNINLINEINSRADTAKEVARLLKKKLQSSHPKTIFLSLIVIDMAMQKCGNPFHVQVATKEFMNALVQLIHNKDLMPEIHKKVLNMIQNWGKKFERDHDILPLFSDVYKAMVKKGIQFPDQSQNNKESSSKATTSKKNKKLENLSVQNQTIIKQLNLLKGNINLTNEMLDNTKNRQELKENSVLIDLLKTLKEMEPKVFELIEKNDGDEDVMNCCLLVNEDMQKTFQRFKAIKNNEKPEPFQPGEFIQIDSIQYLEPTYIYGENQQKSKQEKAPENIDILSKPQQQAAPQNNGLDFLFGSVSSSNQSFASTANFEQPKNDPNDPFTKLNQILSQQNQPQQQNQFQTNVQTFGQNSAVSFQFNQFAPQQSFQTNQSIIDPFGGSFGQQNTNQFQTYNQPINPVQQSFNFNQNISPFAKTEEKIPSFMKKQEQPQNQGISVQNLLNFDAKNFSLDVNSSQPQNNQFGNSFGAHSFQTTQVQSTNEFEDLYKLGTQKLKSKNPEDLKRKKDKEFVYNPISNIEIQKPQEQQPPQSLNIQSVQQPVNLPVNVETKQIDQNPFVDDFFKADVQKQEPSQDFFTVNNANLQENLGSQFNQMDLNQKIENQFDFGDEIKPQQSSEQVLQNNIFEQIGNNEPKQNSQYDSYFDPFAGMESFDNKYLQENLNFQSNLSSAQNLESQNASQRDTQSQNQQQNSDINDLFSF